MFILDFHANLQGKVVAKVEDEIIEKEIMQP